MLTCLVVTKNSHDGHIKQQSITTDMTKLLALTKLQSKMNKNSSMNAAVLLPVIRMEAASTTLGFTALY